MYMCAHVVPKVTIGYKGGDLGGGLELGGGIDISPGLFQFLPLSRLRG